MTVISFLRAWPRNPATGAEVAMRLAGGGTTRPFTYGGDSYRAGIDGRLLLQASLTFDENGWSGGTTPTSGALAYAPGDIALRDSILALDWRAARVEVDAGDESIAVLPRILTGEIANLGWSEGRFVLTFADRSRAFDKKVMGSPFAGTGGIEGHSSATGRPKRRSWGVVRNVEGRMLDPANNIWEFGDPAQRLQDITTLRDKGRAGTIATVTWQGSIAATLAALQASTPTQGGGVVAPSIACAKWWTTPAGPLTADIQGEIGAGYINTVPAIASRLVELAGGAVITNLATAIGWRPDVAGLHVDDPNETWSAAIDRLTLGASLLWVAQPSGSVVLRQWAFTAPVAALKAQFISRDTVLPPTKTRTLVHQRNHRVHGDGEISAVLLATDVNYSDGTSVNALRPAEAGANVTETRTAAAIIGQGAGATANSLSQLDASAGVAVQRAIQQFVSFVNASAITAGYNSFAKNSATVAAATSAAYPSGISFRFRALNLGAAYAVLLTPNANDSTIYAGGDYGVYFTGGNQMRLIVNGLTEIVGATSNFEELAFNYDSQTGVLEWWRGQQLIRSVTLATGLTLYASFRPTNSTTAAIENVRIEPYSAILRRINSVEGGATVTIGEGSLNRNGFFDLVDSIGNLLAWSVSSGAPMVRTASSEALKGSYVAVVTGTSYDYSDVFPVRPGQRIYHRTRIKVHVGDNGLAGGTSRFGLWLSVSDGVTWSDYAVNLLADTARTGGTWYATDSSVVLAANYAGVVPRYARFHVRSLAGAAGVLHFDYLDARDQQEAATLGAQAGTNIFRTDGTTVMTQAEIRTPEGTAAAISGQAAWATYTGLVPTNVAGQVQFLSTGGNLDTLTRVTNRRMTLLLRDDGTTALTEAAAITSLGTAAAIAGQGALATLGQVNLGAAGRVFRDDGTTRLTDALAVTSLGTAAAIAGQAAWATYTGLVPANVAGQVQFLSTGGNLDTLTRVTNRRMTLLLRDDGTTALTEAAAITALGTASAIVGQGSGATANNLAGLNATESARFYGIEAGADVTANVVPFHNPSDVTTVFYAQAGGFTLDGGQLPRSINIDRIRGATNVSTSATWSIVDQGGITGGTVTVANGLVTIPVGVTLPSSAVIIVRSVRDGVTIESRITVIRQDAVPPLTGNGGGTSVTDPTLNSVSGASYTELGRVTVRTGSAGTITVGASAATSVEEGPATGTFPVTIRIGIRPIGGSLTYQATATSSPSASSTNIGTVSEPEYTSSNGNVTSNPGTLTGYSANTDYEVILEGARTSGTPTKTVYFSGSLVATGG